MNGLERHPDCHSERNEESLRPVSQILRYAQNDRPSLHMSSNSRLWQCTSKGGNMFTTSFHKVVHSSEQQGVRHTLSVPIVYERVPVEPLNWEYHVLTIDAREEALPDVARLNELGREGWLMIGAVDQRTTGKGSLVQYYFVRQLTK